MARTFCAISELDNYTNSSNRIWTLRFEMVVIEIILSDRATQQSGAREPRFSTAAPK